MNKILFPGFNLDIYISPIAFSIGDIQIYWYAIFIVFAMILSLVLMYFSKEKYHIEFEDLLEILIFSVIFGFIGARIFYVVFKYKYYIQNPMEIFNIRNGGLAIYGGIIFGTIASSIICKKKQISFLNFGDFVIPYIVLSQAIGRLGNFTNIEAYGKETNSIFRMGIETISGYREVHPCFLYEMIGCIIVFIILKMITHKQKFKGQIIATYLICYGTLRFFIELLRADSLMFFSIKISCIISILCVCIGLYMYIKSYRCRKMSKDIL